MLDDVARRDSSGAPRRMPAPIIFAYDFPHKKTQDIILRLVADGWRPAAVFAAPAVQLRTPPPALRVKPRHVDLVDPAMLCEQLAIEYHVVPHDSDDCLLRLDWMETHLGVISGARILPQAVIERFRIGIVNWHPGLLPHVRGLDALQWAIYRNHPLGVTAHLISERVDAGWILEQRTIDEYPDDSLIDLSLRLYETQLAMIDSSLRRAAMTCRSELATVGHGPYNRSFPPDLVPELLSRFSRRFQSMHAPRTGTKG